MSENKTSPLHLNVAKVEQMPVLFGTGVAANDVHVSMEGGPYSQRISLIVDCTAAASVVGALQVRAGGTSLLNFGLVSQNNSSNLVIRADIFYDSVTQTVHAWGLKSDVTSGNGYSIADYQVTSSMGLMEATYDLGLYGTSSGFSSGATIAVSGSGAV